MAAVRAMRIAVRTFAAYRQAIGQGEVTLDLAGGSTPRQVWEVLAQQHPDLRRFPPPARYAVNDEFVEPERLLADRDEVALIPPVSGGAEIHVGLTPDPIDTGALLASVQNPQAGAVLLFTGTVRAESRSRHVRFLEYEAHDALAEQEMRRIAEEAAGRWPVLRVAAVHRLGRLEIGEISVAIAVSAPHRDDAFAAGRFLIDTLKQTVPIWKKEVWAGGEEWIGSGL